MQFMQNNAYWNLVLIIEGFRFYIHFSALHFEIYCLYNMVFGKKRNDWFRYDEMRQRDIEIILGVCIGWMICDVA